MTLVDENRESWLERRRTAIGGSDAPAVVGVDPWKSSVDVWLDKLGMADPVESNPAMEWGNRLEGVVADHFADTEDLVVRDLGPFEIVRSDLHPFMACTPDRLVAPQITPDGFHSPADGILQIKTTGERMADRWDNGPPDYVIVQLQHEIACTGADHGWIAVLIGGRDYRSYRFERDDELIGMLIDLEGRFWRDHVEPQIPPAPDGTPAAADAIARLYPESVEGAAVDLDDELDVIDAIRSLAAVKAAMKQAQDAEKVLKANIQAALGTNEIGLINGKPAVTWKTSYPARWDTKTLEVDHPELVALYKPSKPQRTLLIKDRG